MKNKEKAGIGTDATRAEVIETLLRRHCIALEKKELKPTAKGTELITLVEKIDPMIADPVLTARNGRLSSCFKTLQNEDCYRQMHCLYCIGMV